MRMIVQTFPKINEGVEVRERVVAPVSVSVRYFSFSFLSLISSLLCVTTTSEYFIVTNNNTHYNFTGIKTRHLITGYCRL